MFHTPDKTRRGVMSDKDTVNIPIEEYNNLCSYRRVVEDKENVYQRVVVKEDGVTRCETMQVFAPEEYQQRVEEWCAVYNGGKDLNADELRELYSLRSRIKDMKHHYDGLSDTYHHLFIRHHKSLEECAMLEKECNNLKSKLANTAFWKTVSLALALLFCAILYSLFN